MENPQRCYVVTFELGKETTRKTVEEKLKSFSGGYYCPIHGNAWAIMATAKASEIRDALNPLIELTDRVFVVRSGAEAAWKNSYGPKNDEWLKKNL